MFEVTNITIDVTPAEHAIIAAALRLYAGLLGRMPTRVEDVEDIVTDAGIHEVPSSEEVDALATRLT